MRLDALTGLRFFAALLIVLHHLPAGGWYPHEAYGPLYLNSGVSFFFVLSGFILQFNYRESITKVGFGRFIWLRFARLWPAHVTVLLLTLALISGQWRWLKDHNTPWEIASIVGLLHSWVPEERVYFAWNSPSWSISTELAFYAAFPLLSRLVKAGPIRTIAATLGLTVVYLVVAQAWLHSPTAGIVPGLATISPLARVSEFTLGIVTCEAMVRLQAWGQVRSPAAMTALEALLVGIAAAGITSIIPVLVPVAEWLPPVFGTWLITVCMSPIYAAMILVMSFQGGSISAFLRHGLLIWLGNISFAAYLVHQPLIRYIQIHQYAPQLWSLPAFAVITIALSAAIYRKVELPCIAFSRRIAYASPVPVQRSAAR